MFEEPHTMNELHSENFDLCRICLSEPESDRTLKFLHVFKNKKSDFQLNPQIEELLGIKIESNDIKPKIVCENCYKSLLSWYEMKKKAQESQIVINYIATKKFGANNPGTSKESYSSATLRVIKPIKNDVNLNASSSTTSTSRYNTIMVNKANNRGNMSIASTSRSNNSIAQNSTTPQSSRSNYNHSHSSRTIITTISRVESLVAGSVDDCIEIQDSANIVESKNCSRYDIDEDYKPEIEESESEIEESEPEIEESKPDINNTNNELFSTADHESVAISIKSEDLSEDESADNSFFPEARDLPQTSGSINNQNGNENKKLYYCSICQKNKVLNHKCFECNKHLFTCLVPNCNILSRSVDDFLPHYQLHIGMPSSAVMCKRCYQEIEQSDFSVNGCHVQCHKVNSFKCYTCNIAFVNMGEFAFHKLKIHNARLMDSENNYLCLYCGEYSPELLDDHIKSCIKHQPKNVPHKIRMKMPAIDKIKLIPIVEKTLKKNAPVQRKKRNKKNFLRTSKMILFTCLKPSCNLIFQTFSVFKLHYREHFGIGDKLVCWQCCNSFDDLNGLRTHQVRGICRIPGMFKCGICPENFDDIERLSVHKYTFHDGNLIAGKKNNKTIKCAFCKQENNIYDFKSHLISCQKKKSIKTTKCTNNLKGADRKSVV